MVVVAACSVDARVPLSVTVAVVRAVFGSRGPSVHSRRPVLSRAAVMPVPFWGPSTNLADMVVVRILAAPVPPVARPPRPIGVGVVAIVGVLAARSLPPSRKVVPVLSRVLGTAAVLNVRCSKGPSVRVAVPVVL